jgi:hypothetical protein
MNNASFYAETFRQAIVTYAFGGTALSPPCSADGSLTIQGQINVESDLGFDVAQTRIQFNAHKWDVEPPEVWVDAEWLQPRGEKDWNLCADWHRQPKGKLCWIRPDCWMEECKNLPDTRAVERAAAILTKDVSSLLGYHLLADKLKLKTWPKEWDAWPHGSMKQL